MTECKTDDRDYGPNHSRIMFTNAYTLITLRFISILHLNGQKIKIQNK